MTKFTLDPDAKQRWVAALRSGKYKQGQGRLKSAGRSRAAEYKYCCLGVACEIGLAQPVPLGNDSKKAMYVQDDFLPRSFQHRLAAMNDGDSLTEVGTFEDIADWIEENL